MSDKGGWVYILTNRKNGTLYVGVTNDLQRRMREHKNKLVAGFSKKYNLTTLVYIEEFSDIADAIMREKEVKGWKRIKKIALIEDKNSYWRDLAKERFE